MVAAPSDDMLAGLPDPGQARTFDELVERLRALRTWAGDPSYAVITEQVNALWEAAGRPGGELTSRSTVVDCFKTGRRRLNTDLLIAIVQVLHPDVGYRAQWRQALRVVGGETQAAAQVRVHDRLPQDVATFTGRSAELDQLRQALHDAQLDGDAVVISAIEGMAGVGKTQLAIHAGHLLTQEKPVDRVLFVNLRGFHPDPAQPPADAAAVLDGFLRLLGVPGQQIPHTLAARSAAYRDRLAGGRSLVVLDNAADAEQVRPLLPATPGCLTLVTSRRALTELQPATRLTVDVFTPREAIDFLAHAVAEVPIGADPDAAGRIAARCGHLPLALSLVAGHIRSTSGWTLTDHADRLDERHHHRRLDTGVQLALDLSYQHLSPDRQRLLRLAALHPGQDFEAYAAAALTNTDLPTTHDQLHHLHRDHLLQQTAPGRYSYHDLVRAYAIVQTGDNDPPPQRHAALVGLFDYYLATATAAMDVLFPAEIHRRPRISLPATPNPPLAEPDTALAWLDAERPNLVAVAVAATAHGLHSHTTRLSMTLHMYLVGGNLADAQTVHEHANRAAQRDNDPTAQGYALTNLAFVDLQLGRPGPAGDHLRQALTLFQQTSDHLGHARALAHLSMVQQRLGRYQSSVRYAEQALVLYRRAGDRVGEARILGDLGLIEYRLGLSQSAIERLTQALSLHRQSGDQNSEAGTLNDLGCVETRLDWYESAGDHLQQALILYRQLGNRSGEASTLDNLGSLHTRLGKHAKANHHFEQALAITRQIGHLYGQASILNGLGEAAQAAGHAAEALAHHSAAHAIATDIGAAEEVARANAGLSHAHRTLDKPELSQP